MMSCVAGIRINGAMCLPVDDIGRQRKVTQKAQDKQNNGRFMQPPPVAAIATTLLVSLWIERL
jgi:hypothetical protein